jgi:rhamnulokinase
MELNKPLITPTTLAANYTNEGGVFGTTRFLKNVMGLWLLQECQRIWRQEKRWQEYTTLLADVETIPPFAALFDPDDARFLAPDSMPEAINHYLIEHGQASLKEPAAFARAIMESLVLRYREEVQRLKQLTGIEIRGIHILGGGSQNQRINQWLADASGLPVIAGPTEATALGNALIQLVGLGELATLSEVRAIARQTQPRIYTPQEQSRSTWDEAAMKFREITTIGE